MGINKIFLVIQHNPFTYSLIASAVLVFITIIPLAIARYRNSLDLIRDIRTPRTLFNQMPKWGKRATWAHKNSFESFTLHAPAILMALITELMIGNKLTGISVKAAILYPIFRLLYIIFYLLNVPIGRALFWGSGMICTGIIYTEGLRWILKYGNY
ncbi:MAPEG family protein [Prochlorococcus sp. MIT 1341]|uniref:MAPEG family protein n=1 Tax=Prochlorococcus sp. MIT 1341 TaxID=3096221 RepID=UPI002A74FD26|nr:MAPEG family protein [Prochlorococcus sp. MIT 1341]